MEIKIDQRQGKVSVTVLSVSGSVDGSNYQELIIKGKDLVSSGTSHLLLDLTNVSFLSSAGLVALHRLALILRGEDRPVPESGWEAMQEISSDLDQGFQKNFKLLNPQPKVAKSLNMAGFTDFFEIYTDLDTAIASFK